MLRFSLWKIIPGIAVVSALVLSGGPIASASIAGASGNVVLKGVSCTGPSNCVAAGGMVETIGDNPVVVTLIEHWNGTNWSVVPTPNPGGATASELRGISCASSTACMAVGTYSNASFDEEYLAERWNGSDWTLMSTPSPTGGEFNGVSCTGPAHCLVVGYSSKTDVAVAATWSSPNGWTVQSTPARPPNGKETSLSSISCVAQSWCTAVGSYVTAGGASMTLTDVWDGTAWTMVVNPDTAKTRGALSSVSCFGPVRCMAAGFYYPSPKNVTNLIMYRNGSHVNVSPSPIPSAQRVP